MRSTIKIHYTSKTININCGETSRDTSHKFWCRDQDTDTQREKVTVEKCRIAFRLFLLGGGMLLLRFGSKVTTWWSLNLCGCSWGCSVLSWILLLDWLDGLILAWVYCCPIEVWYVASWNTLFAESPFFAEIFIFISNLFRQCNLLHVCDMYH